MKRNIRPFWDTYGISKHEKLKQKTRIYIYKYVFIFIPIFILYIFIYIYISPQNIYTGRIAKHVHHKKNMYAYVHIDMLYKAKERIILRVPDSPNNTRNIGIHPYTAYFGGFWSKFLSLLVAF